MYLFGVLLVLLAVGLLVAAITIYCRRRAKIGEEIAKKKEKESSPWSSKGVLCWGAFWGIAVLFECYEAFSQPASKGDLYSHTLPSRLLGTLILFALCLWWYDLSKKRIRQGKASRILGYIIFGIGSVVPIAGGARMEILGFLHPNVNFLTLRGVLAMGSSLVISLIISAGLLVWAYYLQFQSDDKATLIGTRKSEKQTNGSAVSK